MNDRQYLDELMRDYNDITNTKMFNNRTARGSGSIKEIAITKTTNELLTDGVPYIIIKNGPLLDICKNQTNYSIIIKNPVVIEIHPEGLEVYCISYEFFHGVMDDCEEISKQEFYESLD